MELKTLKDLDFKECGRFVSDTLVRSELKAEAIKWYKQKIAIDFVDWREFFNITSEDLK